LEWGIKCILDNIELYSKANFPILRKIGFLYAMIQTQLHLIMYGPFYSCGLEIMRLTINKWRQDIGGTVSFCV
jgi:hypothetical protein